MPYVRKDAADLICFAQTVLNPRAWLARLTAEMALKIPHLDEIPSQAILPLAKLAELGVSDTARLARVLGIEVSVLDEYLGALCEFQFARWTGHGYEATDLGVQAFDAVGEEMVAVERVALKARLEEISQMKMI